MQDQKIRLQKMLADCGVASRRKAEELIQQGKVKVNGHVAQIGDKVNPKTDHVTVAGRRIVASRQYYYIMLHKPRGYVSTMSDEMGRKCVAELVKDIPARVYPVGRLEFANLIMHPSKHVPKTYRVTVRPDISEEQLALMNVGMEIDGVRTAPADAWVISREPGRVVLEIILREGRNRQIRKMCEQLGVEVARLKRVAVGQVKLGMLQPGKWRNLTLDEVKRLAPALKR